ncbi:terminase small subunit [Helcococcus kunzii]|uniref:terminase small subunit n=1 Tax=Helcococcus kunzii TaxID=40091 RepID=UPI0038A1773E
MLTPKKEKFVQGLIQGLSQRQAYKQAYNTKNMKYETIDSRASKLLKEYKVSTRYNELMKTLVL